jgi:hypothetical protein
MDWKLAYGRKNPKAPLRAGDAMRQVTRTYCPWAVDGEGSSCSVFKRALWRIAIATSLGFALAAPTFGQSSVPPKASVDEETTPRTKPGNGRRVIVRVDSEPGPIVAKVHVEVDDKLSVILPDGQIQDVLVRDATPTDRPFQAISKDELAKRLTEGEFKGFQTRQTKRFLYVYNTSETFYIGTSRILETMYPALFNYCKKLKLDVHDPDFPLVVIMFRTKDEFDAFNLIPEGVVAYYSGMKNHVVMYEHSQLSRAAPEIALKQAISTVAHEGVHQILQNIGVQQRLSRWPMWISEGLAEYFAPTELGKNIRWKGIGMVNDLRMRELEAFVVAKQASLRPGGVIVETIRSRDLTSAGYASAWALTHFLASRRQTDFVACLQEVSKLGPLETWDADEREARFIKHFGAKFEELEGAELIHLRGLPYDSVQR